MNFTVRLLCAITLSAVGLAQAQDYPSRPIRVIVPAPPGGAPDAIARIVGQKLSERLHQQVLVDNRGGGNGVIGSELAARAVPDGYTLVLGYAGPFSINPSMYEKLPYDPVHDFAPISMLALSQNVLVVHPSFPARSLKELIVQAKEKSGALNYASGGSGQSSHLSMELLMQMASIKMTHIPYKGAGPALADTISGHVPLHFVAVAPAIPLIKAGKLVALGVTGVKRVPSLPDVPTIAEAGLPGYEVQTWYGAFARAGTPPAVLKKLQSEVAAILKLPDILERFDQQGLEAGDGNPAALARYLEAEIDKW
ncbi:MAG: tripartite tricarboxylate transporter substrate binding protein, partial [Burkholderiales bacterium]